MREKLLLARPLPAGDVLTEKNYEVLESHSRVVKEFEENSWGRRAPKGKIQSGGGGYITPQRCFDKN